MTNVEKNERRQFGLPNISEPPKAAALESIDYNNLKVHGLVTTLFPENAEHVKKTIRGTVRKDGIWPSSPIVLVSYPDLPMPEIGAGRTRYQCGKDVGHNFTKADFYLMTFASFQEAEEWIIKEGGRRNLDDDQQQNVVIELIKLHPDWGLKRLGNLAGVSHMTVSRARKKLTAAEDKAKADAKTRDKQKEAAFDNLVKYWGEADDDTQERFIREYKTDLADLLRAIG